MLADEILNTKKTRKQVYVRLLNEGTNVFRPVSAIQIDAGLYQLEGFDIYDPDDEEWEFLPGTVVLVEEQILGGKQVLLATSPISNSTS